MLQRPDHTYFPLFAFALGSEADALLDSLWKEVRLDRKRQILKR